MSDRVKFVRQTAAFFVASHQDRPDADKAIVWAEKLWGKLTARGYGDKDKTEPKPRDSKDWYKELSQHQQKWFCLFWEKFSHKQGRNEAAMRWGQLGELPETEYRAIVDAAKSEAARPLPQGQVRKMAQGWLAERRWEDHAPATATAPAATAKAELASQLSQLAGDLRHAQGMVRQFNDPYWIGQVDALTAKLDALRGG